MKKCYNTHIVRNLTTITLILILAITLTACATSPSKPPALPPPLPPATLPPTPGPSVPANIIPDLAYIEAYAFTYTDDADPEPEGIEIGINWYDTKSKRISFGTEHSETKNIPVSVDIEVHQRGFDMKAEDYILGRCIYKGQAQIDSSECWTLIPFEDINATYIPTPQRYSILVKLTVHTPKQGDYFAETIGLSDFGFD